MNGPLHTDEKLALSEKRAMLITGSCLAFLVALPLFVSGWLLFIAPLIYALWILVQLRRKHLKTQWKLALSLFVLMSGVMFGTSYLMARAERTPDKYLIPSGYKGWLTVEHGVQGAPPLAKANGYDLYPIPPSGQLETSSTIEHGWAIDEFYYQSANGLTRLSAEENDPQRRVWDGSFETDSSVTYFVGSETEYKEAYPELFRDG